MGKAPCSWLADQSLSQEDHVYPTEGISISIPLLQRGWNWLLLHVGTVASSWSSYMTTSFKPSILVHYIHIDCSLFDEQNDLSRRYVRQLTAATKALFQTASKTFGRCRRFYLYHVYLFEQ